MSIRGYRRPTPEDLELPDDWEIVAAADAGTYMSGVIAAIPPRDESEIFVLEEFPNYHYVSGTIELIGLTVREWIRSFGTRLRHYTKDETNTAWTDRNSTFVTEIGWGVTLIRNFIHLEVRTEVTREYFQHGKIHLAPWLKILPYELEHAGWPEKESQTGTRYTRRKGKDHTLDCLEHICSKRPRSSIASDGKGRKRFLDRYLEQNQRSNHGPADVHLGDN